MAPAIVLIAYMGLGGTKPPAVPSWRVRTWPSAAPARVASWVAFASA